MTDDEQFLTETFHELDPNGKSPHEPGAKLDQGKVPVFQGILDYFPRALMAVAEVSAFGASKYAWKGWQDVPDGMQRYKNASARHMLYRAMGDEVDPDSGLLHECHEVWNHLAALELRLREKDKIEQPQVDPLEFHTEFLAATREG
jgi:hypothetical protein